MLRSEHRRLGRRQQRIQELSRKSWRVWAIVAGLLLAVWGGAGGFAWWSIRRASASDHLPAIALEANQDFVYDLSKLESGQSRFFTYPVSSSERARLLLNRDSEGTVRTAFATCTTCYSFRAQHYLKQGQFICGQCQNAMRIGDQKERMTQDKGCVAVPVPFSVENNKVMVRAQAIIEGTQALASAAKETTERGRSKAPADAR
jgi:uncharacterized membrane protein